MSNEDIIRAWKDENYWESLDPEQKAQLPENPAGIIELSDEQSQSINGGGTYLSTPKFSSVGIEVCQGCRLTYNCGGGGGGAGGGGGGTLGLTCDPMGQCKEN
jgi:mersacidin/lichenicidin family type 2 lantibiotic